MWLCLYIYSSMYLYVNKILQYLKKNQRGEDNGKSKWEIARNNICGVL